MNLVLRNGLPAPTGFRPHGFEEMERLMDSMLQRFLMPSGAASSDTRQAETISVPRMDVAESDAAYRVEAELPGVKKEDIKVSVREGQVTLEAEINQSTQAQEGERLLYSERVTRKFSRSFKLPMETDEDNIEAKFENGVLTLVLPKKQPTPARTIAIQ